MYEIWMNNIRFPVVPDKITTKIHGNNKTLNLINEAEVNQIKGMKLTEISFDLLLPGVEYSFAYYDRDANGKVKFLTPQHFLDVLEKMKLMKKPFKFKLIRNNYNGQLMWDNSMEVTLENYEATESAEELFDIVVSIELKQYVPFGVKRAKVKKKKFWWSNVDTTKKKKIPSSYQTKKGDTLRLIGKKVYGKNTVNNASVLYKKNKKQIDKVLKSKFNGKFSKRIYTESIPGGVKLKVPGYVKNGEIVQEMEGVME